MLAILFGLASALSWGAGDFSGGLAAKRSDVYGVVILSQLLGISLLVGLALLLAESLPSPRDMLLGGLAGTFGSIGLVALYRGLARGPMGVVAPVAALVSAAVPVLWAACAQGLPSQPQQLGFGLALAAVWFVSRPQAETPFRLQQLGLPLVAGLGFGLFLIAIGQVSASAVLWPLVAARAASLSLLLLFTRLVRPRRLPARQHLPIVALVGLFDTGGNAFFALAAQAGRLDVAAVLGSLYPAATVLLARTVLQESISRRQWLGIALALVAVALIAW